MFSKRTRVFALVVIFMNAQAMSLLAQATRPTTAPAGAPNPAPMSDAELEQLVAPVALYPDSLISQIFMASTYPLEVVQADRFAKANPKLTGDALTKQLEAQPWDASVKSLVNFPTVLAMMSEKLDSTIKLGDALLDDQGRVLATVQKLRAKAKDQGNLKSNDQQIVKVEAAPSPVVSSSTSTTVYTPPAQVITIEPANPQVVYVPTYNPTVVYGTWPYPAYPPYSYYPPGYAAGAALVGFGVGVAVGAAWGYAWGNCNWGGGDVNIDYNRNTNINNNIDRSKYQQNRQANQTDRQANRDTRQGDRQGNQTDRQGNRDTRQTDRQGSRDTRQGDRGAGGGNKWQHDPSHRQGVAYRDNATNQKFGGADNRAVQSREAYRGRADSGRQQINNGAANQYRGQNAPSAGNRANNASAGNRANTPSAGNRAAPGGSQNRAGSGQTANPGQNRPSSNDRGSSATNRGSSSGGFSGVGGGGNSTRSASQRGSSSRSSSGGSRSSGGGRSSGGSRGGGGGRGGGGRR